MTMMDAYCLYNRARGTDLISPEDMFIASNAFGRLGVKITVRMLNSKVWLYESGNPFAR